MRYAIAIVAIMAAGVWYAPDAVADPGNCGGIHAGDADCGGHSWSGPQRQTWDTPGYYGGWNTGPELCSPFDYECQGVSEVP